MHDVITLPDTYLLFVVLIRSLIFEPFLYYIVRHSKENLPTDLDVNSFQSNNLSILVLFLEKETFPPINKPKHLFVIAWTSIQIYL